jgi:hypothetical protein
MHLDPDEALLLKELGFPQKKPTPGDIYRFNKEEWIVGGCLNSDLIIVPRKVINDGIWLPTHSDLWNWLQQNNFTCIVSYVRENMPMTYTGYILLGHQKIEAESGGFDHCLFKLIRAALEAKIDNGMN